MPLAVDATLQGLSLLAGGVEVGRGSAVSVVVADSGTGEVDVEEEEAILRTRGQWSLPYTVFLMTQSHTSFKRRSETTK